MRLRPYQTGSVPFLTSLTNYGKGNLRRGLGDPVPAFRQRLSGIIGK